jgi:hypothetical protein
MQTPAMQSHPMSSNGGSAPAKSQSQNVADMKTEEHEAEEALPKESSASPNSATASPAIGIGAESGELARARAIAQRLGITNLTDDEYDIPTYMRRQQEREL